MELRPGIAGVIFKHAGAVGKDLALLGTYASLAVEGIVTPLTPQPVGTKASPVVCRRNRDRVIMGFVT